jgi:hypothetical protein
MRPRQLPPLPPDEALLVRALGPQRSSSGSACRAFAKEQQRGRSKQAQRQQDRGRCLRDLKTRCAGGRRDRARHGPGVTHPIDRKPVRECVQPGNVEPELVAPYHGSALELPRPARRQPARGGATALKTNGEPGADWSSHFDSPGNGVPRASSGDVDVNLGLLACKRRSRQHQEERGQADQDAVAAIHERPFVGLRQNPNADIIDSVRKALVTKTSELPNVPASAWARFPREPRSCHRSVEGPERLPGRGPLTEQLNRCVGATTRFPRPHEQTERQPRLLGPVGTEQRHLDLVLTHPRCDHVRP